jgi:hypothetical protein
VSKAAMFGVIPPFLLQTDENPKGVPGEVFDGIKQAIVADRYAYFDDFFANFYNTDVLAPARIGDAALRASFQVAAGASPHASYACVDTWLTDFRRDLPKIDVPTLGVHRRPPARRGVDRRPHRGRRAGRPAQHRLDAPRRGQRGAARVPRQRALIMLRRGSIEARTLDWLARGRRFCSSCWRLGDRATGSETGGHTASLRHR